MAKLMKKSLPQQIADALEAKIKAGEYPVGERLPTEPQLMEMFGVSRNTVREAVQSLTHSGLLESRQGDGTYVMATEKLQVEFFNIMGSSTYQNVLEVRDLLEKHIVLSAIQHRTDEDLTRISHFLQQRKALTSSVRENTKADLDFHVAIAAATHNELLLSLYTYISEYIRQFIYQKLHEKNSDQTYIDSIHDKLFQAILSQDSALALDCVNKIIEL